MSEVANVVVRPVTRADRGFVFNRWLHNQYWSSTYYQAMPQYLFFKEYPNYITNLLSNPNAKIDVATIDDDSNMIFGYLVYTDDCVHWCYVKPDYRGKGILRLLLKDKQFKYFTSQTPAGLDIAKKLKLVFNPFIT